MNFQKCLRVFDECGCFLPRFDDCQLKPMADTAIVTIGQPADTTPFETAGILSGEAFTADKLTLQTPY
jgi:hypothetical protein